MKKFGVALVLLMFGVPSVAQETVSRAQSTVEGETIKAEAEKSSRAFLDGDFSRVLDLTYPRILEMGGGKAKLLEEVEKDMKSIADLGLKIISHVVGEPDPSVRAGSKLLSVVPTTLKMESQAAFITQRSFWIAVSTDEGKSWTFIDGSSLNEESLKVILPEAVDRIKLPVKGKPVIEKKPAA